MTSPLVTPESAINALAIMVSDAVKEGCVPSEPVLQALGGWALAVRGLAELDEPPTSAPVAAETHKPYWMYSDNEESWSSNVQCATREEAIAEAIQAFSQGDGGDLVPGGRFFTGITDPTTVESLSESRDWGEDIVENIDAWLYDNIGEPAEEGLDATKEMTDELHNDVEKVVRAWIIKHGLTPKCWLMEEVQKHFVDACDCTTRTPEAKGNPTCSACKGSGLVLAQDRSSGTATRR